MASLSRSRCTPEQYLEMDRLEGVLRLPSLSAEMPLSVVYERIEFAPDVEMPTL